MLATTQFLLQFFAIWPFFLNNLVQFRYSITSFPLLCSMFHAPSIDVVGESISSQTIFQKKNKPSTAWNLKDLLLDNMIDRLLLLLTTKLTVGTLMFFLLFTSPPMSCSIRSPAFPIKVVTCGFLVSVKGRHYLKKNLN